MEETRPVLIVGAGPTGLTAAIELTLGGVPVRIIDKAAEPSRTSRALAIQARTLELFSQRGLSDEMLRLGNPATGVHFHGGGKELARIDFKLIPSRFNFVLLLAQNETERILTQRLSRLGIEVERPTELIAFSQSEADAAVKAVLRHGNGRLEELDAAYLICAEGAHSGIRRTSNLPFKGESLEQSYALADLHIDGGLPEDSLSIFVSHQGLLALFPMGDRRFRMIATDPEGHRQDAGNPGMEELQKLYNAEADHPATLRDPVWTSRFRINSRMLDTFRCGRIFFGGDSAHIHSPAGGQGMNTGIQDMINLGWKMALVYRGQANPDLLDTYTEERLPVIRTLLETTETATDTLSTTSPFVKTLITHIAPFLLDFDKIQEKGVRILSQVAIQYRSSRLSKTAQASGDLRAGDRLPDCDVIEASGSSAVPLYSLLDPTAFTLVATGAPATPPSGMKVLNVRVPEEVGFGTAPALFAVRPDAYIGFAGGMEHATELQQWFKEHFSSGTRL